MFLSRLLIFISFQLEQFLCNHQICRLFILQQNKQICILFMDSAMVIQELHKRRSSNRRIPTRNVFVKLHQNLRERCTFGRALREDVRDDNIDELNLDRFRQDPETSIFNIFLESSFSVWHVYLKTPYKYIYIYIDYDDGI